ncbi:helicase associated domain-containing protein [Streptomyces griseorubiginosus]
MVWSVHASAWDAGLAVARDYAAVHGHCLPGATVVWDGYPLGTWLKNQRAAAKKTRENAVRRANGKRASPAPGSSQRAVWRPWRRSIPGGRGGMGCRVAALLSAHSRPRAGWWRAPGPGGRGDRAGRRPRSLGGWAAGRVGSADAGAAVPAGERRCGAFGRGRSGRAGAAKPG